MGLSSGFFSIFDLSNKASKMAMRILAVAVLAAALVGCGPGHPPTYSVTGIVTLNGDPVEGARVYFAPTDPKGKTASGDTDAQGKFSLRSYGANDGAQAGSYKVFVTKAESVEGKQIADAEPDSVEVTTINHIPVKYNTAATTDITADVTSSGLADFKVEMTGTPGK